MQHLMCVAHWRMVPKPLRDEVYAAHRKLRRPRFTDEQLQSHRAVCGRAIAAVMAKLQLRKERERAGQPGFFL